MIISKSSLQKKALPLLIFAALFCSSMFMFETFSGMTANLLLFGISCVTFFLGEMRIKRNSLIALGVILASIGASMLINRSLESLDVKALLVVVSAWLIVSSVPLRRFLQIYNQIMLFLAAVSLCAYFLFIIAPDFYGLFPVNVWREGSVRFVNLWLCVVPVSMSDYFRNFGIFYEPGIYQFFLNFALMIELFFYNKINVKRVAVFAVAIITTLSTNGYITLILLFTAYGMKVLMSKSTKKNMKQKMMLLICASVMLIVFVELLAREVIDSRVFMKFTTTRESGSFADRTGAIGYALDKIYKNPLLGVAYRGIQDAYNVTFTPLNWFMLYGIVIFGTAITGYMRLCSCMKIKRWLKMVISLSIFTALFTQDLSFEWFVWCVVLYGLIGPKNNAEQRGVVRAAT